MHIRVYTWHVYTGGGAIGRVLQKLGNGCMYVCMYWIYLYGCMHLNSGALVLGLGSWFNGSAMACLLLILLCIPVPVPLSRLCNSDAVLCTGDFINI